VYLLRSYPDDTVGDEEGMKGERGIIDGILYT